MFCFKYLSIVFINISVKDILHELTNSSSLSPKHSIGAGIKLSFYFTLKTYNLN